MLKISVSFRSFHLLEMLHMADFLQWFHTFTKYVQYICWKQLSLIVLMMAKHFPKVAAANGYADIITVHKCRVEDLDLPGNILKTLFHQKYIYYWGLHFFENTCINHIKKCIWWYCSGWASKDYISTLKIIVYKFLIFLICFFVKETFFFIETFISTIYTVYKYFTIVTN